MTVPDDMRPWSVASTERDAQPPSLVGSCEGCGLVVEVDLLGGSADVPVGECSDCGSPVYLVVPELAADPSGGSSFLAGFGAGWDACAAFMAGVVAGEQGEELAAGVELAMRVAEGEL